jgi:DNA-binding transcriptional regulator LsrR (DeoR family)
MKTQREEDPALIFRTTELFLQRNPRLQSVESVVAQINREFNLQTPLTRENVYPLLNKARQLQYLKLEAPLEEKLARDIEVRFNLAPRKVVVVDCPIKEANEHVSAVAARQAMVLARQVRLATGKPVGFGIGPGRASLDFSRYFSEEIRADTSVPELNLVAISAGAPANAPQYSSISFFNLFPPNRVKETVGLFAETLVPHEDYEDIKRRPGVMEAFAAKDRIDIVVTSMGDIKDEHDLFRIFLTQCPQQKLTWLNKKGCVGNVQYRPYSARGPIVEDSGELLRAVTLFELSELETFSMKKNKHVVLIGRRCGVCELTRARALRPILENESLRVFSVLVIDSATAQELLNPPQE